MDISEEIWESHRILSDCSLRFLEYVRENPDTLKRSSFEKLFEFKDYYDNLQPWPLFIDRERKQEMASASIRIFNLVKSIPKRFFGNDPLAIHRYFGFPLEKIDYFIFDGNEDHINDLTARGDFIFSPNGLKCVEFNVSANLGGWVIAFLEPYYLKTPIIAGFLQQQGTKLFNKNLLAVLFEHLLNSARRRFTDPEINVAIMFLEYNPQEAMNQRESSFNRIYRNVLAGRGKHEGGEVAFCDHHKLTVSNGCLFLRGKRIHALLEMGHGVHCTPFKTVLKSGNLCLFNGPATGLLSNKLILALLSENQDADIFSPEEKATIRKYIPWTRKVEAGLEEYIIANRQKLIVKPAGTLGGKGVFYGKIFNRYEWREVVKLAVKENWWIVQEYVDSYPYLFQFGEEGAAVHHAVWGFFVFGNTYGGAFVRIIPEQKYSGVINTHKGARKTVVLEVNH